MAFYSDKRCAFCKNSFETKDIVLVFKCGHMIQQKCCDQKEVCIICFESESDKGFF